jgi:hypothetical protein
MASGKEQTKTVIDLELQKFDAKKGGNGIVGHIGYGKNAYLDREKLWNGANQELPWIFHGVPGIGTRV